MRASSCGLRLFGEAKEARKVISTPEELYGKVRALTDAAGLEC